MCTTLIFLLRVCIAKLHATKSDTNRVENPAAAFGGRVSRPDAASTARPHPAPRSAAATGCAAGKARGGRGGARHSARAASSGGPCSRGEGGRSLSGAHSELVGARGRALAGRAVERGAVGAGHVGRLLAALGVDELELDLRAGERSSRGAAERVLTPVWARPRQRGRGAVRPGVGPGGGRSRNTGPTAPALRATAALTFSPSLRKRKPVPWMAVWCTNTAAHASKEPRTHGGQGGHGEGVVKGGARGVGPSVANRQLQARRRRGRLHGSPGRGFPAPEFARPPVLTLGGVGLVGHDEAVALLGVEPLDSAGKCAPGRGHGAGRGGGLGGGHSHAHSGGEPGGEHLEGTTLRGKRARGGGGAAGAARAGCVLARLCSRRSSGPPIAAQGARAHSGAAPRPGAPPPRRQGAPRGVTGRHTTSFPPAARPRSRPQATACRIRQCPRRPWPAPLSRPARAPARSDSKMPCRRASRTTAQARTRRFRPAAAKPALQCAHARSSLRRACSGPRPRHCSPWRRPSRQARRPRARPRCWGPSGSWRASLRACTGRSRTPQSAAAALPARPSSSLTAPGPPLRARCAARSGVPPRGLWGLAGPPSVTWWPSPQPDWEPSRAGSRPRPVTLPQ